MPRLAAEPQIDRIIQEAADAVVARVSAAIARSVAERVEEGMRRELGGAAPARRGGGRRRGRVEISRWVADARARRVPTFVIQSTGLDTKKKIVAKFGPGAVFEKGKPVPRVKA